MEIFQPILGLIALPAAAWVFSENRRRFPWRIVAVGLPLQLAVAAVLLKSEVSRELFLRLNNLSGGLQDATAAGAGFVFGYLGGAPLPFEETSSGASFILAFQSLPMIFIISALSALLWHWRVLPVFIKFSAMILNRAFSLNGGTGLAAAANIFVGMVEAPLLIRPVFARLSRADIFLIMSCGMATIAGTVLFLYATILSPVMPGALGHLLTASVISIPAAVMFARIMVPARQESDGDGSVAEAEPVTPSYSGSMDAVARSAQQGISLYLNIIAMLVVLVAFVHICNSLLSFLPEIGGESVTLQGIFGFLFRPLMWLIGIPWHETDAAGALMGTKTALNEFVAYLDLAGEDGTNLSGRSRLILLYAMSGFANFGSLGIIIGGLSSIAPERRAEIAALGMRSLLSGSLATCMTGAVAALAG